MKMCVLLLLQLWMMACSCVVPILLPPTNLTVISVNFNHTLHWTPGRHTPPGTRYNVTCSLPSKKLLLLGVTTETSLPVSKVSWDRFFESFDSFVFHVEATSGNRRSKPASTSFEMIKTVLRPVLVSVQGCGDCLLVNASLPRGNGITIEDHSIFIKSCRYTIHWTSEHGQSSLSSLPAAQQPMKIENLSPGTRYCVWAEVNSEDPTLPSDRLCAFTSPAPTSDWLYLGGWVSATVCLGLVAMAIMAALCYSGVICLPKVQLPSSLTCVVRGVDVLMPEHVSAEEVCVSSEGVCVRGQAATHTRMSDDDDDEDDDEDDARGHAYMDRRPPNIEQSQDATGASEGAYGNRSLQGSLGTSAGDSGNCSVQDAAGAYGNRSLQDTQETHPHTQEEEERRGGGEMRERRDGAREEEGRGEMRNGEREEEGRRGGEVRERRDGEREEEVKRGGEGRERRDGEREEEVRPQEEREQEKSGTHSHTLGDTRSQSPGNVNLFSVRLGGLKKKEEEEREEEEKEEEEEEEEEERDGHGWGDEEQPLLTHTHTPVDQQQQRTRDSNHTHTHTQTHTHSPKQTPHTLQRTPATETHTHRRLEEDLATHSNSNSNSHSLSHTHPHTQFHSHTPAHTHSQSDTAYERGPHTHSHTHSHTPYESAPHTHSHTPYERAPNCPIPYERAGTLHLPLKANSQRNWPADSQEAAGCSDWSDQDSDSDDTHTGYLATHTGAIHTDTHPDTDQNVTHTDRELTHTHADTPDTHTDTDDSEEEEEDQCSGYMTR